MLEIIYFALFLPSAFFFLSWLAKFLADSKALVYSHVSQSTSMMWVWTCPGTLCGVAW